MPLSQLVSVLPRGARSKAVPAVEFLGAAP